MKIKRERIFLYLIDVHISPSISAPYSKFNQLFDLMCIQIKSLTLMLYTTDAEICVFSEEDFFTYNVNEDQNIKTVTK